MKNETKQKDDAFAPSFTLTLFSLHLQRISQRTSGTMRIGRLLPLRIGSLRIQMKLGRTNQQL